MSYSVIPLTNAPDTTRDFKITIGTENKHIKLVLRYLDRFDVWIADIYDYPTDIPLVNCVPFVTGENFLAQYRYLGVGEAYIVNQYPTDLEQPDNKTLGNTFLLVWGTADE